MTKLAFLILVTATIFASTPSDLRAQSGLPVVRSSGLERGVNFGNMLEAPVEGEWGLTVQEIFYDKVVEAGLDHIRLPVSWTNHALAQPPYTIDPVFMNRVDWAVRQATDRRLKVILNVHHYDELNENPILEWPRALAIWDQIARRFRGRGPLLYFEILNEPHGAFNDNPGLWNMFMIDALAVIRSSNPTRKVLVGPTGWNSISALALFDPPVDANLIATIHNYDPFPFTHQGAGWVTPTPPLGTKWRAASVAIGSPFDNWSWDTGVRSAADGIHVTYRAGWAGLFAHNQIGTVGATGLELNVDKALNLRISVGNDQKSDEYLLNTTAGAKTYKIALNAATAPIKNVIVQNNTANPSAEFRINRFALIIGNNRENIIKAAQVSMFESMARAADWANARQMPLYLGEFGAYEKADLTSRAAWTGAMRSQAEQLNIGWAYWELAAGFGFYDPVANTWRLPLLQALVP